jgi:AcrR family transcriptional regulator
MPRVAAKDRKAFVEGRRTEIVEAAVRLWAIHGFEGTPMTAVAREVGLTKGTLYLYFDSKLELLDEVLRRYTLRPDVEGLARISADYTLEEIVKLLVQAAWGRLRERKDLVGLLLRELPGQLDKAQHFLEEVMLPTNQLLAQILEDKLPPERTLRINTLVAGRGLMSMVVLFFITQEVLGGNELMPISEDDATSTIAEVFLHGVLGAPAT